MAKIKGTVSEIWERDSEYRKIFDEQTLHGDELRKRVIEISDQITTAVIKLFGMIDECTDFIIHQLYPGADLEEYPQIIDEISRARNRHEWEVLRDGPRRLSILFQLGALWDELKNKARYKKNPSLLEKLLFHFEGRELERTRPCYFRSDDAPFADFKHRKSSYRLFPSDGYQGKRVLFPGPSFGMMLETLELALDRILSLEDDDMRMEYIVALANVRDAFFEDFYPRV